MWQITICLKKKEKIDEIIKEEASKKEQNIKSQHPVENFV